MKKNIAVIAAGYTGEAGISLQGADNIIKFLDNKRYVPYLIKIDKNEWIYLTENKKANIDKNDFSLTLNNKKITFLEE